MRAWEVKQEPDHTGLTLSCPAKDCDLYSTGTEESLKGNNKVGFALSKFSLDTVEHGLGGCFLTWCTLGHTQTWAIKERLTVVSDRTG